MKYFVSVNGEEHTVSLDEQHAHLADIEGTPVRIVTIGNEVHRIVVRRDRDRGRAWYTIWLNGHRYEVEALDERSKAIRELSGTSEKAKGPAPVLAPMPGLVVRILVNEGDIVQAGQGVIVMEAMKMENELRTTSAGTVRSVKAAEGTAVEKGTVLVELE